MPRAVWLLTAPRLMPIAVLAGRFANDGKATDGQIGGRSGDEGPGTVVLRDTYRGTEAARWSVNRNPGYRVQQT